MSGVQRRVLSFNDGYEVARGNWIGQPGGDFQAVMVPHDYARLQPGGREFPGGGAQGYVDCFHTITYRKHFVYQPKGPEERCWILFDGVFRRSSVYLNGQLLGERPYGYVPFYFDMTPFLKEGGNLLEVLVDNAKPPADRWYSGMGIYRDVKLICTSDVHLRLYGTYITTPRISPEQAEVQIRYEVLCHAGPGAGAVEIRTEILDGGNVVAASSVTGDGDTLADRLTVPSPSLWQPDSPHLYTARTTLLSGGVVKDRLETRFGIRDVVFDTDRGMFLNGRPIRIKGVNLHHDCGLTGSAFLRDAWIRRLRTLREIGVNAIRCSHNPQAEIFYDLCDEMGFLVFDEAFDKWTWEHGWYKDHFDAWWKADLTAMLERDRNHPCVILWSVGNELENQGSPEMVRILGMLADHVKAFEPTRPVTVALNPCYPGWESGQGLQPILDWTYRISRKVDILSLNYQEQWYEELRKAIPDRLIIGSEVYQYYTGEGVWFDCMREKHPWWYVEENAYVIGAFYWAGADYLGESFGWPARGWSADLLDIAGFERPFASHSRALWTDKPMAKLAVFDDKQPYEHMNTCWSYPKCTDHLVIDREPGEVVRAGVYTNCETVELISGKRSYGERAAGEGSDRLVRFNLRFQPNMEVILIGRNGGVEAVREEIRPFGPPHAISAVADKQILEPDPHSLAFITVHILDAAGNWNKNAATPVEISLSGPLELLGMDNGDIRSRHPYDTQTLTTWKGRCLIALRAGSGGKTGKGTLRIAAPELGSECVLEFEAVANT